MLWRRKKKKKKKKDDKKTKAFYDWATTGIPVIKYMWGATFESIKFDRRNLGRPKN